MALKVTCVLCGASFQLHSRAEGLLALFNARLKERGEPELAAGEIACCSDTCFREWQAMLNEERQDRLAANRREAEETA